MYAFDATPLISLASAARLDLVAALDGDCSLPARVHDEVVTAGIEAGYADAKRIEQAIDDGLFTVEPDPETPLVEQLSRFEQLSDADVAVLALAETQGGTAVMDEQYGRTVADTHGITTRGTAYVVLHAQKRGRIGPDEATAAIDDLVDAGWYCAPDLYASIREKIEEIG